MTNTTISDQQVMINFAIEQVFQEIAKLNMNVFDTWYEKLHNDRGEIEEKFTLATFTLMLKDFENLYKENLHKV
jgi:hypothetical protein